MSSLKIAVKLCLIISSLYPITPLQVACDFGYPYEWVVLGKVLTCTLRNLNIFTKHENITAITGLLPLRDDTNPTIPLTFADVKFLNIIESTCEHLPKGFDNFFPNLEGIRIGGAKLTSISRDDLKGFSQLRYFDAWHNDIDMLPSDLFSSTPNIEYLYFGDNDIKYIGYNTLTHLSKLKFAIFQSNSCINQNANNESEVEKLIKKIHTACLPNDEIPEKTCGEKMTNLAVENENLKKKSEEIEKQNLDLNQKISNLRHQNSELFQERENLRKKIQEFEKNSTSSVEIQRKIQQLEVENAKILNVKGVSRNWIYFLISVMAIVFAAAGFLYKNSMLKFTREIDSERLT